ncbi:MAG: hypothetical protein ABI114_10805 [Rhodanobacter sp.]
MAANELPNISDETFMVLYVGYTVMFKIRLVRGYINIGQTQQEAVQSARHYLSTQVGKAATTDFVNRRIDDLQFAHLIIAISKTNRPLKMLIINLVSAGIGAFIGPFCMAALHSWLTLK